MSAASAVPSFSGVGGVFLTDASAAELISITSPCNLFLKNSEDLIVFIARVSNPENQMNTETSGRLIKYLIKHKHWSPFEMVDATVSIKTSRAIAAQILRHRSFSFQEFSQRYSAASTLTPVELRSAGAKNRQSSLAPIVDENLISLAKESMEKSLETYNHLIQNGVAKETARMILPLSCETHIYMKGSIRSWIHYLDLRCSEDTQKEHREIAFAIKDLLSEHFPNIFSSI